MSISPLHRLAAQAPKSEAKPAFRTSPGAFAGAGDYRTLDIVAMFQAHGLYGREMGGGKHAVTCPNASQHSDTTRAEHSDTVIYETRGDGFPGMHCMHAHCQHLDDFRELVKLFPDVDRFCAKAFQPVHSVASTTVASLPAEEQRYPPMGRMEAPPSPALAPHTAEDDEEFITPPVDTVLPFPTELFPYPIQRMIEESSVALPCPPDFVGVPLLSALASAIGNSRCIAIKEGWIERPVIWTAIVGRPGDTKTPALKNALAPIMERQRKNRTAYDLAMKDYEQDLELYQQELDEWKGRMRRQSSGGSFRAGSPPEKPVEPVFKQLFTTNSTLEALHHLLHQSPRGTLLYQDELAGWVSGMNAYRGGKGGDLQAWLQLFTSASIAINRRGEKAPLQVEAPCVSVTGGIQPDVLPDLMEEHGKADGFIDRILFSMPDPVPLVWTNAGVIRETFEDYQRVFTRLYALEGGDEEPGLCDPVELRFTDQGYRTWERWIKSHYTEMNDPEFPDHLRGPWAKLRGYAARMALALHLARFVCEETDSEDVDHRSMMGAAALMTYFKSHARRVYSRLHSTDEDKKVALLLAWLRKREGIGTAREIQRSQVAGVKVREDAELLMRVLERRGYAVLERGHKGKLTVRLQPAAMDPANAPSAHVSGSPSAPALGTSQARAESSVGCRVGSINISSSPGTPESNPTPDTSPELGTNF